MESYGWQAPIVGHVGDGNFHCLFLFDPDSQDDYKLAKDLTQRMNRRALELGGTITGEHGIGIGKMAMLAEEHGEAVNIMADVKRALDPDNLMNPGKVVNLN